MFSWPDNLSPKSKEVIEFARQHAIERHQSYWGTENLLAGILLQKKSVTATVLIAHDITLERIHSLLQYLSPVGTQQTDSANLLATPRFVSVFVQAQRNVLELEHETICPAHILLAMMILPNCTAREILLTSSANFDTIRQEIIDGLKAKMANASQG